MIAPDKLSLLFLHLSEWVQTTDVLVAEIILTKQDGENYVSLWDEQYTCECVDKMASLQWFMMKLIPLLQVYTDTTLIEIYRPDIGTNGTSITTDDGISEEDEILGADDGEEEETEEEDAEVEEENSTCGFECDNGNCEHPGSHLCLKCDNYQKCPACTKYPCEKLLKEEKENEARAEAALQDDMEEEGN